MVRVSKVVACMFCNEAPCICNAKPKKHTPRKRLAVPAVPIVDGAETGAEISSNDGAASSEIEKAVLTDAIRSAATTRHQGAATVLAEEHVDHSGDIAWILDDPEFVDAIKACESIMHPMEVIRFKPVLESKGRNLRDKVAAWKNRVVNG